MGSGKAYATGHPKKELWIDLRQYIFFSLYSKAISSDVGPTDHFQCAPGLEVAISLEMENSGLETYCPFSYSCEFMNTWRCTSILYGMMINLLKPTCHVMHQQFNIQQLYVLPTLYLCVLYLSENKQRLVPLIS